jgi:hypothetical protein
VSLSTSYGEFMHQRRAAGYLPSKTVGAIGFIVFFLITSLTLWRLVRNHDWWGLCLPIGAFCMSWSMLSNKLTEGSTVVGLGFLIRIFISRPGLRNSLGVYVVMNFFIVLAPAAFLAYNYILYGRVIRICVGREHSRIRPEIVGRTFVISDIVTFLVQVQPRATSLSFITFADCGSGCRRRNGGSGQSRHCGA